MPQAALLSVLKLAQSYVFQLQLPGLRHNAAVLLASLPLAQDLQAQVEKTAHLLNDLIVHRRPPGRPDDSTPPDPLLGLGRLIYNQLLPRTIQQALQALPAGFPLIIATNDPELPWELAHDDEDYLALKYVVTRQMLAYQPPRQNVVRWGRRWTSLLIGNPTGDLSETEKEIEQLIHLIEALPGTAPPRFLMGRRATKEAVLQALASGAYDLIHYAGHATFDAQASDAAATSSTTPSATLTPGLSASAGGLVLAGEQVLAATEIAKALGGRPIVFLNACESARGRAGGEAVEGLVYLGPAARGLASAFIQGGAQEFIGAFWPVHDASSRDFALAFYRSALQGTAIGEALRAARHEARRAGPMDPLWASFVLYGDPHISLLTTKKTERRPATVLVARLLGLDTLFGEVHGEEAVGIVEEHVAALAAQIAHFGGRVHSLAHDTLVGTFGIPTTHQNDAERAVRAALGMGEAMSQLRQTYGGHSLGLGLGLSSGDVFAGVAGAGDQAPRPEQCPELVEGPVEGFAEGVPTVTGEVVNQAAWLARQADDGMILIAEPVHRLTGHLFDTSTLLSAGTSTLLSAGTSTLLSAGTSTLLSAGTSASLSAGPAPRSLTGPHEPEPLTVYQVLGLKPEPGASWQMPGRQTALIGRARELAMLQEAWQMCQRGRGQIVGVVGEAGVGKSRLLYEFRKALGDEDVYPSTTLRRGSGHRWLTAACPAAYSPGPYGLVAQLLHPVFGLAPAEDEATVKDRMRGTLQRLPGADLPEQELLEGLAILGDILAIPFPEISLAHLDPKGRQRRLVNILGRLLAQGASETPLILALEDLHWVDDASLEVLSRLVVGIDQLPILVITLFRPETEWQPPWQNRRNYRLVRLDALDEEGSRALLSALLEADEAPEEIAQVVLPRAGGNPFFIRELATSLQEAGALHLTNGRWRLARPLDEAEVPGTLQRVILTRIQGLPEAAHRVLPIAAVAGDDFEHSVLQAVVAETGDEPALEEGLAQLTEREFIYRRWGEETYHFTHALIQAVAYERLLFEERRRYHRRIGRAMERVYAGREAEVLELLAHHYYHSDDRVTAVRYCLLAAGRAAETWANETALSWYDRALEKIQSFDEAPPIEAEQERGATPTQIPQWHVEALESRGGVQSAVGHGDEATEGYRRALNLAADPGLFPVTRRADLYHKMAIAHHDKGEIEAAQECLNRGLEILGGLECLEAGRLHVWTGLLHFRHGRLDQALTSCERGIAIIEQTDSIQDPSTSSGQALAQAYNLQGLIYRNRGDGQKAIRAHEQSIALYQEAKYIPGLERAYSNLGCVYQDLSRWDDALRYFQKSAELSDRTGEEWRRAAAAINLGEIYRRQGELDRAVAVYEQARQIGEEFGFAEAVGMALMNLGASFLKKGATAEARGYLAESRDVFQRIGTDVYLPEVLRYLAELRVITGQPDEASQLAQEALDWASKLGRQMEVGQAHRILGRAYRSLGRLEEAEAQLGESLAILEEQNAPYEVGLTLVELAFTSAALSTRLRKTQADASKGGDALREQAMAYCERAIGIFDKLGASLDLEAARETRLSL